MNFKESYLQFKIFALTGLLGCMVCLSGCGPTQGEFVTLPVKVPPITVQPPSNPPLPIDPTPVKPPLPPVTPAPDPAKCGSMADGSFSGLSTEPDIQMKLKTAIINQNNALIAAQLKHNEIPSCYFLPTSNILAGIYDYSANSLSYNFLSLEPGDYIVAFKSGLNAQHPVPFRVWQFHIAASANPNLGEVLVTGRSVGLADDFSKIDQLVEANYDFRKYEVYSGSGSGWLGDQPGMAADLLLAQRVGEIDNLSTYNQEFVPGLAELLTGFIGGGSINAVNTNATPLLQLITAIIANSSTIDTTGKIDPDNYWDATNFGFMDMATGIAPAGKRFILEIQRMPAPQDEFFMVMNVDVRVNKNLSEPTSARNTLKIGLWQPMPDGTFLSITNSAQAYTDPSLSTDGQAAAWAEALNSVWANSTYNALVDSSPIKSDLNNSAGTPLSSRNSATSISNEVVEWFKSDGGVKFGHTRGGGVVVQLPTSALPAGPAH